MTRYSGKIGYAEPAELIDGIWEENRITERTYYGDVIRDTMRLQSPDKVLPNVVINNSISVVADAYAYENFFNIRYVEWMNQKWSVVNIEVKRPRLILSLGGIYNGPTD